MTFNIKMHERNPYKQKIDFEYYSSKYTIFRNVITKSKSGKILLNFENPECQQALTWCILKEDFDLDVFIPVNKLIPTIPLRLNYILWIEDIFNFSNLYGIDIGCGSSCIYSLLGAKKNKWHFLSTESDQENYNNAIENVSKNNLGDFIKVVKVDNESNLTEIFEKFKNSEGRFNNNQIYDSQNDNVFNFLMCNPPFFDSSFNESVKGKVKRNILSTADVLERTYFDRGEVGFVEKVIINSSLILRNQIRVYSTMLGKKESVKLLIKVLKENKIENIGKTEFCQGNTMRWGLAWSFDTTLKFPSYSNKRSSFSFNIDKDIYKNWDNVVARIDAILLELEAVTNITKSSDCRKIYEIEFTKNTWSNQRRKKRETKRKLVVEDDEKNIYDINSMKKANIITNHALNSNNRYNLTNRLNSKEIYIEKESSTIINCNEKRETLKNENYLDNIIAQSIINNMKEINSIEDKPCNLQNDGLGSILLKCKLDVHETYDAVELQFEMIEAIKKDYLHCLFQLFKNRFSI